MRLEPCDAVTLSVTATAVIIGGRPGIVQGLTLTPAAAACTVSLYDPVAPGVLTTTNATLRLTLSAPASVGSVSIPISASGAAFNNGVIAVVTGTGAQASVLTAVI